MSTATDVNQRIAGRVRALRHEHALSLDELAGRSGVSRSAISLIERGESSPTAAVLDRLATALDVPLAALFDGPATATSSPSPVARRADQVRWRDPVSGYRRRALSPPGWPSPIRLAEVDFPAGRSVAFETGDRAVEVHQQVYVTAGRMEVTVGDQRFELAAGDCLAMTLDAPTAFHNPGDRSARYLVVLVSGPAGPRGGR